MKFWRRPKHINGKTSVESVDFEHTEFAENSDFSDENLSVRGNGTIETIPCGLVIKSIGYYGIQVRMKTIVLIKIGNLHMYELEIQESDR